LTRMLRGLWHEEEEQVVCSSLIHTESLNALDWQEPPTLSYTYEQIQFLSPTFSLSFSSEWLTFNVTTQRSSAPPSHSLLPFLHCSLHWFSKYSSHSSNLFFFAWLSFGDSTFARITRGTNTLQ
jgi:hypothetical protein